MIDGASPKLFWEIFRQSRNRQTLLMGGGDYYSIMSTDAAFTSADDRRPVATLADTFPANDPGTGTRRLVREKGQPISRSQVIATRFIQIFSRLIQYCERPARERFARRTVGEYGEELLAQGFGPCSRSWCSSTTGALSPAPDVAAGQVPDTPVTGGPAMVVSHRR